MGREYNFELPLTIAAWKVSFAPSYLQAAEIWDGLPRKLRNKIALAIEHQSDLMLTKFDLDQINDETWEKLSHIF